MATKVRSFGVSQTHNTPLSTPFYPASLRTAGACPSPSRSDPHRACVPSESKSESKSVPGKHTDTVAGNIPVRPSRPATHWPDDAAIQNTPVEPPSPSHSSIVPEATFAPQTSESPSSSPNHPAARPLNSNPNSNSNATFVHPLARPAEI
ncbi:hypothetical protein GY45DRAFT_1315820 [Cubamyces sp. BRFM 1775]|nr:hypothetical protein GY45DRAFT_1315820 [Cubamyces sp. BRFM 1775]